MSEHTPFCIDATKTERAIMCVCRKSTIDELESDLAEVTKELSQTRAAMKTWEEGARKDKAEIERLIGCWTEVDRLKADLDEDHVDCIRLQQEINCLRMDRDDYKAAHSLLEQGFRVCAKERDRLKAEIEKIKAQWRNDACPHSLHHLEKLEQDRDRWKGIAEKMAEAARIVYEWPKPHGILEGSPMWKLGETLALFDEEDK